jgi:hypothetical protein
MNGQPVTCSNQVIFKSVTPFPLSQVMQTLDADRVECWSQTISWHFEHRLWPLINVMRGQLKVTTADSTCELACGWTPMQISALTIVGWYGQAKWCCDVATLLLGDLENVGTCRLWARVASCSRWRVVTTSGFRPPLVTSWQNEWAESVTTVLGNFYDTHEWLVLKVHWNTLALLLLNLFLTKT